jgi:HlyD family secretion protein
MSPKKRLIPIAMLLLAAAGGGAWYLRGRSKAETAPFAASGTVEATEAQLGFQTSGQVAEIAVHEGDRVRAGQVLARLDPAEAQARRAQAEAQVAAARDVAHNQATQAEEQLRLVRNGPSRERIDQARAQLAQAEAALRSTGVLLGNLTLTAPFDGLVTVRHREPGEIVAAGSPVLTLINPRDRWVRIYIKEDRVGAVHLGSRAAISSDTYPGKTYPGEIAYIASEAEFTPKNVQTTEERVKLVYAVKVRILRDPTYELKPGLPADVRLPEVKG